MFLILRSQPRLETISSPLRALHALQESHIVALEMAVTAMPDRWSLERHESYNGDRLVLLVPNDETRETFVVSRTVYGFHLSINLDDELRNIGCFASFADLMADMIKRVGHQND